MPVPLASGWLVDGRGCPVCSDPGEGDEVGTGRTVPDAARGNCLRANRTASKDITANRVWFAAISSVRSALRSACTPIAVDSTDHGSVRANATALSASADRVSERATSGSRTRLIPSAMFAKPKVTSSRAS